MSRLGVFGGTFDPIHLGHLFIAEEARGHLGLDRVVFIPVREPPHERIPPIASANDRLTMVRLAIAGNPPFEASAMEVEREGPSYTVDTLERLQEDDPGADLFFVVGTDSLGELPNWHRPGRILELARLVAVARPGREDVDLGQVEGLVPEASGRVVVLESPELDISATEVRRRVAEGRSIRYLVPDAVIAYIRERGLYRQGRHARPPS